MPAYFGRSEKEDFMDSLKTASKKRGKICCASQTSLKRKPTVLVSRLKCPLEFVGKENK